MEEYNEKLLNVLDKQFPKGDKARGRALLVIGLAQIEIDLTEVKVKREMFEEITNRIKEEIKEKLRNSKDDWVTTLHRELKEEMIDNL